MVTEGEWRLTCVDSFYWLLEKVGMQKRERWNCAASRNEIEKQVWNDCPAYEGFTGRVGYLRYDEYNRETRRINVMNKVCDLNDFFCVQLPASQTKPRAETRRF